ncbi:MAG: radical SAM protein [Defluviitaleaceae bacterium]|nr:radical SAM protein [Defluviitaleaceae bacterium]
MKPENKSYRTGQLYNEAYCSEEYKKHLAAKSAKYTEYRNKWETAANEFINYGYPINLDIETAAVCNLKCPMCHLTLRGGQNNYGKPLKFFPWDLFCRIIDEAAEIGVCSVKLMWMGEPLMNPQIIDMIKYAKQKGILDVTMNTNAVLLTEEMSRRILETDLDGIFFSFDSPDKESYEKIRIGAKFEDVVQNIKRFCEMRKQMGKSSPTTRINTVLFPGKEEEFDRIIALFKDSVDIVAGWDWLDMGKDYSNMKNYKDELQPFSCRWVWQRISITVDGRMALCCQDQTCNSIDLENINETTIKAAWNSPQAQAHRQLHKEGRWYDNKQCSQCHLAACANGFERKFSNNK